MKKLQKSDLKEGEIYKQLDFDYIFLYNKNETYNSFNDGTAISTTDPRYCKRWSANDFEKDMIEATPEEKHWLETCIKENKFVYYEEAMKTFIPEYLELLPGWSRHVEFVGEIFDTKKDFQEQFKKFKFISKHTNWKEVLHLNWIPIFFKPSTKEAYDAQFVVKEPEFVLPEKWCIKLTEENYKTLGKWRSDGELHINSLHRISSNWYLHTPMNNKNGYNTPSKNPNYTEITFEQFKKYVLKDE